MSAEKRVESTEDRNRRMVALCAARASGDEKLAELVEHAVRLGADSRVWRGPRWQPSTSAERDALAKQPDEIAFELRPGDPVPPRTVPRDKVGEWVQRIGADRIVRHKSRGVSVERIDPDDRRDTLSREEIRRMRVDKWDRVWCHLAEIPTPVMGWRGHLPGTLYLFLVSAEEEAQKRWRAVWDTRGPRPDDVLLAGTAMFLLGAAPDRSGFGMATVEPGALTRTWRPQLEQWRGEGDGGRQVQRLACEIRADDGRLVWTQTMPARRRGDLLAQVEAQVAQHLPTRQRERIDAHPSHLACWLLKTGHGRLSEIPGRTFSLVAEVILGAPSGMRADTEDEDRPEWRAVRAHVAAAQTLIDRRRASKQVSHR